MLGSNRNREERSHDSEAKPRWQRWREAPVTQGESMITVTGGSKRPVTKLSCECWALVIEGWGPNHKVHGIFRDFFEKEKYVCSHFNHRQVVSIGLNFTLYCHNSLRVYLIPAEWWTTRTGRGKKSPVVPSPFFLLTSAIYCMTWNYRRPNISMADGKKTQI